MVERDREWKNETESGRKRQRVEESDRGWNKEAESGRKRQRVEKRRVKAKTKRKLEKQF